MSYSREKGGLQVASAREDVGKEARRLGDR